MGSTEEQHEVRTALAIVRGGADLLSRQSGMPPERWDIACDLVLHGLERLRAIDPTAIERETQELES